MQQMLRVFGASVLLVGTVACDNDKQADRARAPSSAKPPVTAARPKAPARAAKPLFNAPPNAWVCGSAVGRS